MGIHELLDNIIDDNYAGADKEFESLLGDKISDVLDQEKISVAQGMFGENVSEDEDDDIEFDDDEDINLDDLDLDDIDLDDIE